MKRIKTTYRLAGASAGDHETIERVLGFHADYCPVARSIRASIEITTALEYVG